MRGLWGNFWIRLVITALVATAVCLLSIWCAPYIATALAKALGLKDLYVTMGFHFSPSMFFGVLPAVPFWLLAEPRIWGRREPFPLGSYLAFGFVFFLIFYPTAYVDVFANQMKALQGLILLVVVYLGSAALAAGAGYGYYRLWRRQRDRLPPVIPDVF